MGFDFRYPNITGTTPSEQMTQTRNFLHQLVDQLQWAFNNISTLPSNVVSSTPQSLTSTEKESVSPQATFDSIKYLIIKSAEIVEAYSEEINKRFVSEYVASSEFGEYREQATQDIETNSKGIAQFFTNLQQIISDVENLNFRLLEVDAHINSGLLYEKDGIPVYGLEIGQKNKIDGVEVFNKYARFTSDRLSFYDQNDSEVAYISDYKLYITRAEVTGSLKLGGFLIDTSSGLTMKWVGRG